MITVPVNVGELRLALPINVSDRVEILSMVKELFGMLRLGIVITPAGLTSKPVTAILLVVGLFCLNSRRPVLSYLMLPNLVVPVLKSTFATELPSAALNNRTGSPAGLSTTTFPVKVAPDKLALPFKAWSKETPFSEIAGTLNVPVN